jgi:uncharacterized membrane protein
VFTQEQFKKKLKRDFRIEICLALVFLLLCIVLPFFIANFSASLAVTMAALTMFGVFFGMSISDLDTLGELKKVINQ